MNNKPTLHQIMRHFNLKQNMERVTEDTFFLPKSMEAVLEHLKCFVYEDELAVLSGPIGSGKTTIIRKLICELEQSKKPKYEIIEILSLKLEELNPSSITGMILDKFNCRLNVSQPRVLLEIQKKLGNSESKFVVIIDEAHRLPAQLFVNIKQLTNLSYAFRDRLLSLILVGQPSIAGRMQHLAPDLFQRVRTKSIIEMPLLSAEEKKKFLERYGGIFTQEAVNFAVKTCQTFLDLNNCAWHGMQNTIEEGRKKIDICDISAEMTLEDKIKLYGGAEYVAKTLKIPVAKVEKAINASPENPEKQKIEGALDKVLGSSKALSILPTALPPAETEKEGKNNVVSLHAM